MKNNNIAFDLDGTLVDFISQLKDALWNRCKAKLIIQETYHLTTDPEISKKNFWKAIWDAYRQPESIMPYVGARNLLEKLFAVSNQPIKIVTARPKTTESHILAMAAVKNCFGNIPVNLVCTGGSKNKLPHLKNIDYFVEDRRQTAISLANAGKYVFLIDRAYNQINNKVKNIKRIASLDTLYPVIHTFVKHT